jgi:tetratricopeptide (TPR) repeat protein
MATSISFSMANKLRKNGQFAEALAIYESNWADETQARYEWDTWSYAFCLKKANRYADLLDLCRKAYPSYPNFEALNSLYAWAIYFTAVKPEGVKEAELLKAAAGIVRLAKQDDAYAPFTLAVLRVVDVLAAKKNFDAKAILQWLDLLQPNLLDTTPSSFTNEKGRVVAIASKYEQWASMRAKALYLNAQYDDCLAQVAQALEWLPKLHYGNEHWLRRYAALCHAAKCDFAKAIELLELVYLQKRDWFLAYDLATVLMRAERVAEALPLLQKAAFGEGDIEKKVKVYKALAKAYTMLGEHDLSIECYELVALVRSDFGWLPDTDTTIALQDAGIEAGRFGSSAAMYARLKERIHVVQGSESSLNPQEVRIIGNVMSILPNGKAGFVKAKFGKSYYFQFKDLVGAKSVKVGDEVSFQLIDAVDPKKQTKVQNAVRIERGSVDVLKC